MACADNRHGGERRHTDISARAFAQLNQYRFAAAIEKTWGLAGESGTLESSRVLVNERLPQKVRLFKFLEGGLLLPITLLENCGVITLEIADRTHTALVIVFLFRVNVAESG